MDEVEVIATFGPPAGDPATLSKASLKTIEALYRHPLTHNLGWSDVVALFERLGSVAHKHHHEVNFAIGGEHHRVQKPHQKELTAAEVMQFRHMLTRAGWAPQAASPSPGLVADTVARTAAVDSGPPDLLAVVDHHEARLYHLDIQSTDLIDTVIEPHDPHHVLHHLSHKDHAREHGQRSPEDDDFYERIAQAIASGGRIVVVGHGKGHSNAAHHLMEFLQSRHPVIAKRLVCEVAADLSGLTAPQLVEIGRRALSA